MSIYKYWVCTGQVCSVPSSVTDSHQRPWPLGAKVKGEKTNTAPIVLQALLAAPKSSIITTAFLSEREASTRLFPDKFPGDTGGPNWD